MDGYGFTLLLRKGKRNINHDIYRFRNDFNDVYLVEVFHYEHNVYAIKFFQKKHRLSKNRYNITYPREFRDKVTGNRNFLKILHTVNAIAMTILKDDELASFGFLGAPRLSELDPDINGDRINPDSTVSDTKRYRIYGNYVRRYYDPKTFKYIESPSASILLLMNQRNQTLTEEKAVCYIRDVIIPEITA